MKATHRVRLVLMCLFGFAVTSMVGIAAPIEPTLSRSLKNEPRPEPSDLLTAYATDKQALIALGKALFWDMQVGSDGVQACASCHFHAGADSRSKNQMSPGLLRAEKDTELEPDTDFTSGKGPNYQLKAGDFPFHKLADALNRKSTVQYDTNDVESSQGIARRGFSRNAVACDEVTSYRADDIFEVSGTNTRRVEPRHTPTVINAVFNHRNFWDGRAQDIFNGVNHRGGYDPSAHLYRSPNRTDQPVLTSVRLEHSSLASQAVAPPLSDLEMSAAGRTFAKIGKRLVKCKPLAKQLVHPDDSVLGSLSLYNAPDKFGNPSTGINKSSYAQMIRDAFRPEWWDSNYQIVVGSNNTETIVGPGVMDPNAYTLMEYNFSLFFGLALQAYQATLVADDTPWDRYNCIDAANPNNPACGVKALTPDQLAGANLFFSSRTRCANCHRGSALTDASVSQILGYVNTNSGTVTTNDKPLGVTRLRSFEVYTANFTLKQRQAQLIDTGFNNIGVRSTLQDLGVGGKFDPGVQASRDLSIARRCENLADCNLPTIDCFPAPVLAVDGAMKIPGLRNVALTAPYFHNGGALTLTHVLDFYLRGGDFNPVDAWDASRTYRKGIFPLVTLAGPHFETTAELRDGSCNAIVSDPDKISVTPLTTTEKNQIIAFLQALTDERVRTRRAPFDHPQLFVPNGHPGDTSSVTDDGTNYATDDLREITMTGRNGGSPLSNFLQ